MNIRKDEIIEAFLELYDWYRVDIEQELGEHEFFQRMHDIKDRIKEDQLHQLHLWNQLHGR